MTGSLRAISSKGKAKTRPLAVRAADVTARAVAAVGLGYLTAALSTALLSRVLPGPKVETVMTATLLSFAVYAAVAIWSFADPKLWRIWLGLVGFAAVASGLLWLSLTSEPRL